MLICFASFRCRCPSFAKIRNFAPGSCGFPQDQRAGTGFADASLQNTFDIVFKPDNLE
ncbi:hypothetical protein LT85_1781 [Collimonas arenae]|uniref:Uncharacterized protein n=1 Tax=Collimonas arenae TaxID=279058 RepID=A0A0A1FB87_9BURK|nr:hypothetical protein LT85_1781 [Collimonas arenae]